MTNIAYYQKYLEKVDECLHFRNNPDKAIIICKVLYDALQKYQQLTYNKYYFGAFYHNLYLNLQYFSGEFKIEDMQNEIDICFNEQRQGEFRTLSNILDRLSLIIKTNDDESFNKKIQYFLKEINDFAFIEYNQIIEYQQKAKRILDEYNYTPTQTKTVVVEKKNNSGCMVALIFLIPNLIINYFKN
jgi:hypothetical protein